MKKTEEIKSRIPEPRAIEEMIAFALTAESLLLRYLSFFAAHADDLVSNLGVHPDYINKMIDETDDLLK